MYVKKGWQGLSFLVLLLLITVYGCNREMAKQADVPNAQEQLEKRNQELRDSLKKARAEIYWYLNPKNTWLQERARGIGGGCVGFNENFKPTPNEVLTQHKEHLGYLPQDEFVEIRRRAVNNPKGSEIVYERYYKGVYVMGESLVINIDEDGYANTICARFQPNIEKMYKQPLISEAEAKEKLLLAFREQLSFFSKNVMDSVLKTENGIVYKDFRLSFEYLKNGKFDLNNYNYGYSAILHIPGLNTLEFDTFIDAITGEVKRMEMMGVRNANIPICTNHYGNQNLDAELHSQVGGIDQFMLVNFDRRLETRPLINWNTTEITTPSLPSGPNCTLGCNIVGTDFCDTQYNTSLASAQWAVQTAYDYIINSIDLQDGIYENNALLPIEMYEIPISIVYNIDLPLSFQGSLITSTIPYFPHVSIINQTNKTHLIIAPEFKSTNYGLYGANPTSWKQLTTLDVLGHELTHAFLNYTSFSFFSNAALLNSAVGDCFDEAVCDIWGALIERNELGNNEKVWVFFDDQITNEKKLGRSMKTPNTYYVYNSTNFNTGQPDYYKQSPYWNPGFTDVYINNGIFNHWFYLLANGGENEAKLYSIDPTDTDMVTDGTESTKRVSKLWLYEAQDVIHQTRFALNSSPTRLYDIVLSSVNAAIDLFGGNKNNYSDVANCTNELIQVVRAWRAVGIELKDLPRGEIFPTCITCRTGCETDGFINGDLETGMDCDNDPNTSLANCNCTNVSLDLELVQHNITPVFQSCEGSTVGGVITFTPQYSRENCPLDIFIDGIYQGDITSINSFTGISEGTHTISYVDANDNTNTLSFDIYVPKKEIYQTASPIVSTTNETSASANNGSITVNIASIEIVEFLWDFPGGSSVDLVTHNNTINNLDAGNYSVTVKFAGTECIYGIFNATVNTDPKLGIPICYIDDNTVSTRVAPKIFSDAVTINIALDTEDGFNAQLKVYNMQGIPVANLIEGGDNLLQGGTHTFTFDGSNLPNGLYAINLKLIVPSCPRRVGYDETIRVFKHGGR